MYYQSNLAYIYETQSPGQNSNRVEIGDQAVWTLSSSKPGNGVEQLCDQNTNTFWQSDGGQPHTINIQFMKKIRLQEIALYLDFKSDESYTPNKISFRIGNSLSDLREYVMIDLKEPVGWFVIPFKTIFSNEKEKPFVKTMNIQLCILQNQHSGKDTHIRQIKVFGPKDKNNQVLGFPNFKDIMITQYQYLR